MPIFAGMKALLPVLFLALIAACQNTASTGEQTPAEPPLNAIAGETCRCWQPYYDFYQKLQQPDSGISQSQIESDFELIEDDLDDCLEKLGDRYGELEEDSHLYKMDSLMQLNCPDIFQLIVKLEEELE